MPSVSPGQVGTTWLRTGLLVLDSSQQIHSSLRSEADGSDRMCRRMQQICLEDWQLYNQWKSTAACTVPAENPHRVSVQRPQTQEQRCCCCTVLWAPRWSSDSRGYGDTGKHFTRDRGHEQSSGRRQVMRLYEAVGALIYNIVFNPHVIQINTCQRNKHLHRLFAAATLTRNCRKTKVKLLMCRGSICIRAKCKLVSPSLRLNANLNN